MTKQFRMVTDDLFWGVSQDEAAKAMGCSVATIRQARRDPGNAAYRKPPAGWEKAARKLAEAQAAHFTKLAAKLTPKE
jgi:transposase